MTLRSGNQLAECEVQARESWEGRRKLYGATNQVALEALWLLANTVFERGDLDRADALLEAAPMEAVSPVWLGRSVAGEEERFWLVRTLTGLAWHQRDASKPANPKRYGRNAESLARPLVLMRQSNAPADLWRLANARSVLGGALVAAAATDAEAEPSVRIDRLAGAELILMEGYSGLHESNAIPTAVRPTFLQEAAERLVRLHEFWDTLAPNAGHAVQAAKWRQTSRRVN